jgi:hypothetical protein
MIAGTLRLGNPTGHDEHPSSGHKLWGVCFCSVGSQVHCAFFSHSAASDPRPDSDRVQSRGRTGNWLFRAAAGVGVTLKMT